MSISCNIRSWHWRGVSFRSPTAERPVRLVGAGLPMECLLRWQVPREGAALVGSIVGRPSYCVRVSQGCASRQSRTSRSAGATIGSCGPRSSTRATPRSSTKTKRSRRSFRCGHAWHRPGVWCGSELITRRLIGLASTLAHRVDEVPWADEMHPESCRRRVEQPSAASAMVGGYDRVLSAVIGASLCDVSLYGTGVRAGRLRVRVRRGPRDG